MARWPASHGEALRTRPSSATRPAAPPALAVLHALESESLVRRAAELGARWLARLGKRLAGNPRVRSLRGRGLLVAVEFDDADYARAALDPPSARGLDRARAKAPTCAPWRSRRRS